MRSNALVRHVRVGINLLTTSVSKLVRYVRAVGQSGGTAVFVLISSALLFSGHQELFARDAPYDEYYFLLRSTSFDLFGSRLAPIKEYLYSLLIHVSRIYGLNLRNFEVICYGAALAWLLVEVRKLTRSVTVAWLTVLPLAFFTYQSPVFNLTTYDALQLILTPLTIGSAIMIYRTGGRLKSLIAAGTIAGLQVLTRPEGILFIVPPILSLVIVCYFAKYKVRFTKTLVSIMKKVAIVCIIPIVFQQGMCAVNYAHFGFWAPTIMKSEALRSALTALMSIRPANDDGGRYAPVPISSMEQAYKISPAFRMAKAYFDPNVGGHGWSAWAPKGYETHDGSIDGGHFEWALLEASAFAVGQQSPAMTAYLTSVSEQIDRGFRSGAVKKRFVLSPALGPNFSIFNEHYWTSVAKISGLLLNHGGPILPQVGYTTTTPMVDRDFNRLALRRTALVQSTSEQLEGWLVNRSKGLPNGISLNEQALASGVALQLVARPDVAGAILNLSPTQAEEPLVGFRISVPDTHAKNLGTVDVTYGDVVAHVPLAKLLTTAQGLGFLWDGVTVQVDMVTKPIDLARSPEFLVARYISLYAYYVMRLMFLIATAFLVVTMCIWGWRRAGGRLVTELSLIALIALSIILPRTALLSAVDAFMFPGTQPRYLAVAAFSMWFFATFVVARVARCGCSCIAGYAWHQYASGSTAIRVDDEL